MCHSINLKCTHANPWHQQFLSTANICTNCTSSKDFYTTAKQICIHKVTFALFLIFYMHCIFLGWRRGWHTRQHSKSGFHILVNWSQFVHLTLFLYWGLEVLKILILKSTDIREITLPLSIKLRISKVSNEVEIAMSWLIDDLNDLCILKLLGTGESEDLILILYGIIHYKVYLVSHIDPFLQTVINV